MKRFFSALAVIFLVSGCVAWPMEPQLSDATIPDCNAPPDQTPCIRAGIALSGGFDWLKNAVYENDATELDRVFEEMERRVVAFDLCVDETGYD